MSRPRVVFNERGLLFHWDDDDGDDAICLEVKNRPGIWSPAHLNMARYLAECSRELAENVGQRERDSLMNQLEQTRKMTHLMGSRVESLTRERDCLRRRLRAVIAAGKRYRALYRANTKGKKR